MRVFMTLSGAVDPIRDATIPSAPIRISAKDIANGTQGDPKNCAISVGAKRMGADEVATTKTTILVHMPGPRPGSPGEWTRHRLNNAAREVVADYDALSKEAMLAKYPDGALIELLPIRASRRLGARKGEARTGGTGKRTGTRSMRRLGGRRGMYTYRTQVIAL